MKPTLSPLQIEHIRQAVQKDTLMMKVMADLLRIHERFMAKVEELDKIVKKPGPKGERGSPGPRGIPGPEAVVDLSGYATRAEVSKKFLTKDIFPELVVKLIENYLSLNPAESLTENDIIKLVEKTQKQFDPEQWAEKLAREFESLPYEKKLDYHTGLKNQPHIPKGAGRSVGGGGGGTVEFFVISGAVNGSNTAFTLPKPFNNPVICYNGQVLDPAAHYSISGTALTLNTAPTAGTLFGFGQPA
jgi:hypothetical protein